MHQDFVAVRHAVRLSVVDRPRIDPRMVHSGFSGRFVVVSRGWRYAQRRCRRSPRESREDRGGARKPRAASRSRRWAPGASRPDHEAPCTIQCRYRPLHPWLRSFLSRSFSSTGRPATFFYGFLTDGSVDFSRLFSSFFTFLKRVNWFKFDCSDRFRVK